MPREIYSIGMERVAYTLGDGLGLPIPSVWLEEFEGAPAALVQRLPQQRQWDQAHGSVSMMANILNRDLWPLCAVFDVWLANRDRRPQNILIVSDPPGTRPAIARGGYMWLIDHGFCGLWPPQKFDDSLTEDDLDQVDVTTGTMRLEMERWSREQMPAPYRDSFRALDQEAREPVLGRVLAIADDQIENAVGEVPRTYMSATAVDRTIALLKVRRDRIDEYTRAHW